MGSREAVMHAFSVATQKFSCRNGLQAGVQPANGEALDIPSPLTDMLARLCATCTAKIIAIYASWQQSKSHTPLPVPRNHDKAIPTIQLHVDLVRILPFSIY